MFHFCFIHSVKCNLKPIGKTSGYEEPLTAMSSEQKLHGKYNVFILYFYFSNSFFLLHHHGTLYAENIFPMIELVILGKNVSNIDACPIIQQTDKIITKILVFFSKY